MESTTLRIDGMHCAGCVNSLTRALQALPGVSKVQVSLADARADVAHDPARCDLAKLQDAVAAAGFEARPWG
ncbi:MAG: heavy-metal-associated domain-containing protein [Rhodocyclaceae bacterium]|nr:heavy-metal-associated domain-containing protein [Rhodocyclaceae bacterium]MBX3668000.1 heavy-metal-associated domain-containing protein [Rhodocyclaceae bacterium]